GSNSDQSKVAENFVSASFTSAAHLGYFGSRFLSFSTPQKIFAASLRPIMSQFSIAKQRSIGSVGCAAHQREPCRLFSSPSNHITSTPRRNFVFPTASAMSSTVEEPLALSSAPGKSASPFLPR